MPEIAVSATSFLKNPALRSALKEAFPSRAVRFADPAQELKGCNLAGFLQGADLAIVGKEPVDAALLAQTPALRAVSKYGVGLDNIDLAACKEQGVQVLHKPGVNAPWVAEMAVGLCLSLMRNIAMTDRKLRQGTWYKNGGSGFSGKTVGVVGCGAVGSRFARLARAFGCRLILCDIRDVSDTAGELSATLMPLRELLSEADIVSLHTPLTPETRGFINKETLALMKPGSILINTSRGACILEDHLQEALRTGHLAGAALDVWEDEPSPDRRFFGSELPLVGTPHISANCVEAVTAMGHAAIQGLLDFCRSRGISI